MNSAQSAGNGAANCMPDYIGLIGAELEKAKRLHVDVQKEALTGKTCQKVLRELLAQIEPVDFRERAGLDEYTKITRKL